MADGGPLPTLGCATIIASACWGVKLTPRAPDHMMFLVPDQSIPGSSRFVPSRLNHRKCMKKPALNGDRRHPPLRELTR